MKPNCQKIKSEHIFRQYIQEGRPVVVAVSGGVDSTSLGLILHRMGRNQANLIWAHAETPAVPKKHTERLKKIASSEKVCLNIIKPREFEDERYLKNPIDRCFYCKFNLFEMIHEKCPSAIVLTGANLDDLDDFRPGLKAAAEFGAQHPFIEAGYTKSDVRRVAESLGLTELASAPSSPCLSSRVRTGTRIDPKILKKIEIVEEFMVEIFGQGDHRCRYGDGRITLEIDAYAQRMANQAALDNIKEKASSVFMKPTERVDIDVYKKGSAFRAVK